MSFEKAEIQALIAEVDRLLGRSEASESETPLEGRHRQVLERVYEILLAEERTMDLEAGAGGEPCQEELPPDAPSNASADGATANAQTANAQTANVQTANAQTALQVFANDLDTLRRIVLQPLQMDLEVLQQQRSDLRQEISQLEARRQEAQSLAQQQAQQQKIVARFLQVLMGRLQESMTAEASQVLKALETQLLSYRAWGEVPADRREGETEAGRDTLSTTSPLHPSDRLEQMRLLQTQSDRMLQTLDATLRVVFGTLLENARSYEISLAESLERMHELARQGETMFRTLVDRLGAELAEQQALGEERFDDRFAGRSASSPGDRPSSFYRDAFESAALPVESLPAAGQTSGSASLLNEPSAEATPVDVPLVPEAAPADTANVSSPPLLPSEAMVDTDDGGLYEDLFGTEEDVEAEDDDDETIFIMRGSETAAELFQRLEASREEASLEALLFEDETTDGAGEALFQSEAVIPEQFPTAAETVESIATSNTGIEAIASLTDLMPILRRSEETHDPVDGTEQGLWEQAEALTADEFSEDTFIPASPDESLLPKEESLEEPDRDIDLSAAAMQQLRQDLSQMEEGTPHPTPIPRSTVSDRPQTAPAESVLEEWLAEEAGERPPSAEIPHGYIQPDPPRPVDTAALDAWFSTPSEAGYAEVASGDLFADLEASAQDYREQVQIPDIFVAASSPTSDPGSPDQELLAELEAATCYDYPEVDLDAFSLEESAEPDLAAIAPSSPSQAVSRDEAFFFAGDGAAEADTVEDVVEADTVEADTAPDALAMDESAASATDADLFAADGLQSDPVAAESLAWEALEATPEAQADAFSLGDTEPAWTEDATSEAIQGFPPAEVNGWQDAAIAAELAEASEMSETGGFETGGFETGGFETGGILAEDESSEETGFAPAAGDRQADLWSDDIPVATDDLAAANELLEDTTPDFYESDDESDEFCEMISEDAGNPFADGYASESEDDSEPLEDVWMADEGEPNTGFASVVPDFEMQQRTESTASEDLVTAPVEPDDFEDPSAALLVDDMDFFDRPVNHAYEEDPLAVDPLAAEDADWSVPFDPAPASSHELETLEESETLEELTLDAYDEGSSESGWLTSNASEVETTDNGADNGSDNSSDSGEDAKLRDYWDDDASGDLSGNFATYTAAMGAASEVSSEALEPSADFWMEDEEDDEFEARQPQDIADGLNGDAWDTDWETETSAKKKTALLELESPSAAPELVDTESAIAPPVGAVAAESSVLTDELATELETGLETDLAIDLATADTDEDLEGVFGLAQGFAQGFAQINDASAPSQDKNTGWYLGIDCGTMGLTAVLWHQSSDRFYPIQWFPETEGEASPRLPLEAYIDTDLQQNPEAPPTLWVQKFKSYLKAGIPYRPAEAPSTEAPSTESPNTEAPNTAVWEPLLQWSEHRTVSLRQLQQVLQDMLATLLSPENATQRCTALGLDEDTFATVKRTLTAIVVGCPAGYPETYRFNLREAILAVGAVDRPDRIFFLEDAIATLISHLSAVAASEVFNPQMATTGAGQGSSAIAAAPARYNGDTYQGITLVLNAGATTTEIALVDIPEHLHDLRYSDFTLHSFPYAGDALDQDIILQLILSESAYLATDICPQPEDMPQPGEPDVALRHRVRQRLQGSAFGQTLMEIAAHLKVVLQYQERYAFDLGEKSRAVTRQELERWVLVPFVQRLNRELNALLSYTRVPVQAIDRAICTGGNATWEAIARWLRQKLPNATILQDTYSTSDPALGSRVAYGLAGLPRFPQLCNLVQHQYSDLFLLRELLEVFPSHQPLHIEQVLQLLERRGVNTQTCYPRIAAILNSQSLPVLPQPADENLLAPSSRQFSMLSILHEAPVFYLENYQLYRPNPEAFFCLRQYFEAIAQCSRQNLQEPLAADVPVWV